MLLQKDISESAKLSTTKNYRTNISGMGFGNLLSGGGAPDPGEVCGGMGEGLLPALSLSISLRPALEPADQCSLATAKSQALRFTRPPDS